MNRSSLLVVSASVAVCSVISGCAQTGVTLPSMGRVFEIAKESAKEPATWIPLTAAAAIGVTGSDDNISEWASDNTPVFGSRSSARDASDDIKNLMFVGMAVSSIVAPTPDGDSNFRTRRIAANALAFSAATAIVEAGKVSFKRDRPNDRNDRSFPSGHSKSAFTSATLIEQNLNETIEKPWLRNTIKAGTFSLAAATAWARVEAEEHFPVDVLFSAGLSNFISKTFYRAIVTEGRSRFPPVAIETSRKGFSINLSHSF